jgi:hypothetical protein
MAASVAPWRRQMRGTNNIGPIIRMYKEAQLA